MVKIGLILNDLQAIKVLKKFHFALTQNIGKLSFVLNHLFNMLQTHENIRNINHKRQTWVGDKLG